MADDGVKVAIRQCNQISRARRSLILTAVRGVNQRDDRSCHDYTWRYVTRCSAIKATTKVLQ